MLEFSYILGYRQTSSVYREKNLKTVLDWLNNDFKNVKFEIILVEQDSEPKIKLDLPCNCKTVFAYNNSHYNRSWGLNIGANFSLSDILVFADSDLLIKSNELLECVRLCKNGFDAVDPKGKVFAMYENEKDLFDPKKFEIRKGINFSGGICVFKKNKFFEIFGWDEDITGWGGEDDVMTHKIKKMLERFKQMKFSVFHLFHTATSKDRNKLNDNLKILYKIREMKKEELIKHYKDRKIGQVDKYKI